MDSQREAVVSSHYAAARAFRNGTEQAIVRIMNGIAMKHWCRMAGPISTLLAFSALAQAADRPNIVFILVDDTGWNALDIPADPEIPGSGSSYYRTPNTSRLALSGIRFSMAYSPAPTCGPTRTSIQYGQTPSTVGKFAETLPTNLPSAKDAMVSRLKAAHPEYRAAHFGKWHQRTRTPEEIGYDESDGQTMNQEGNDCPSGDPKLTFSLAEKTNDFKDYQERAQWGPFEGRRMLDDDEKPAVARP